MKPHIYFAAGIWFCRGNVLGHYMFVMFGATPAAAFDGWSRLASIGESRTYQD